ncbi:MAG: serine protease, partial [Methylotetracoccus sp.]|nr:serine protease [Methylotetracoccus sp.]
VVFLSPSAAGQTAGVPIEAQSGRVNRRPLLEQAARLRGDGRLLKKEVVGEQLKTPQPGPLQLPKARTKPLRGRDVAERARQGYVRVGWYYLCQRCDDWHLEAAGGYAIAADAVVTCHHCVEPETSMREAYLIAVDPQDTVLPVKAVLAKSQTMDAVILRVEGGRFAPLPLNDDVAPGDTAYCFSEPLGQSGYFSVGSV